MYWKKIENLPAFWNKAWLQYSAKDTYLKFPFCCDAIYLSTSHAQNAFTVCIKIFSFVNAICLNTK